MGVTPETKSEVDWMTRPVGRFATALRGATAAQRKTIKLDSHVARLGIRCTRCMLVRDNCNTCCSVCLFVMLPIYQNIFKFALFFFIMFRFSFKQQEMLQEKKKKIVLAPRKRWPWIQSQVSTKKLSNRFSKGFLLTFFLTMLILEECNFALR